MITIFNRREVCVTFDVHKLARIREVFAQNAIDYKIKCFSRDSQNFGGGSRGRRGSLGIHVEYGQEYVIYVKKGDFDRAQSLLV